MSNQRNQEVTADREEVMGDDAEGRLLECAIRILERASGAVSYPAYQL